MFSSRMSVDVGLPIVPGHLRRMPLVPRTVTAASWAFVLEPRDDGTRLVERFRVTMAPPTSASGRTGGVAGFARSLLGFGVFVMVRRQMLGIRDRAEGRPIRAWSARRPHGGSVRGAGQPA